MNLIQECRALCARKSNQTPGVYAEYNQGYVPDSIKFKLSFDSDCVESSFEEGGRWDNVRINVYEVTEENETAYFECRESVPTTEIQEDGSTSFTIREVVPKRVVATKYIPK